MSCTAGITEERKLYEGKGGGYIDEAALIDTKKSVCMIKGKRYILVMNNTSLPSR